MVNIYKQREIMLCNIVNAAKQENGRNGGGNTDTSHKGMVRVLAGCRPQDMGCINCPMLVGGAWPEQRVFAPGWFLLSLLGIYIIEIGRTPSTGGDWDRRGRFVTPDKGRHSAAEKTIVDGKLTSSRH